MIQVVGLGSDISWKILLAGYSENYDPLRLYLSPAPLFIINLSPAPLSEQAHLIELASLFEVLRYLVISERLAKYLLSR